MKRNILLIDDELGILKAVTERLELEQFAVTGCTSAEQALEELTKQTPDIMLVDVRLPGMNGFDFCKKVRTLPSPVGTVPIIFLTTVASETQKVLGLELGGDDYITKPFSTAELVARIRATLRRSAPEDQHETVTSGTLVIDYAGHEVRLAGKTLSLSPKEFELLYTLVKKNGRVLTRAFLLENIWGISSDVATRTIDTHIKQLRKALGKQGRKIETVGGLGYKWQED